MTIVSYVHKRKRPNKRLAQPVAIPNRIVGARAPQTSAPVIKEAVPVRKPPAQAAAITGSRIVTAKKPRQRSRIGPEQIVGQAGRTKVGDRHRTREALVALWPPVQDTDAEEHQRRGDAAVALFLELVRRANAAAE